MTNFRRGEIEANFGGRSVRLCLTFGALASLEKRLNINDISNLAGRFSDGRFSAQDLISLLSVGLESARDPMTEAELRDLDLKENWSALLDAAARLFASSFGDWEELKPSPL